MASMWAVKIFAADGQNGSTKTLLNTATEVISVQVEKELNAADKYIVVCHLADPNTAGFSKTTYVELWAGSPVQSLWEAGYVQTVDRSVKRQGDFQLTIAGAPIALSWTRDYGALYMPHPRYLNVIDAFNGINAPGAGAVPGQKGLLSGSGFGVSWQDTVSTPFDTRTTSSGVSINAASVGYNAGTQNITNATSQYNAVSLTDGTGTDFYECTSVNTPGTGAGNISIHPVAQRNYTTPTVKFYGYQLPGTGDSWRTDWPDMLSNLSALCGDYNIHWRDPGAHNSYASGGTLPIGQFGDDSGVTLYGGQQLLAYQQAHGYPELTVPNLEYARVEGLHVTNGVGYSDDLSHVVNIVTGIGHGGAGKFLTIKTIYGTINFAGTHIQPNTNVGGRVYYLGATYQVKTSLGVMSGQTPTNYALWAAEEQDSVQTGQKNYVYGVMNQTSVNTFGPREGKPLIDKTIYKADKLLSSLLGYVDEFSSPVPTWVFAVKPSFDANGLPPKILPGQKVTVKYTGQVYALKQDTNTLSATYGQFIPDSGNQAYQYLTFPASNDPTYPYVSRAMKVTYLWQNHDFTLTVQTGRGHKKPKHYYDDVAKHLHKVTHNPPAPHGFTKKGWEDVQWWLSSNAYVDPVTKYLHIPNGEWVVSDVPTDEFFDDHHMVSFNVNLQDAASYVDFIFAKPPDGTVTNLNAASANYGLFRLAGTSSGAVGQFFWMDTSGVPHAAGWWKKNDLYNSAGQVPAGNYRVAIKWTGGRYRAEVLGYDSNEKCWIPFDVAGWGDRDKAKLTGAGAIGWRCVGGSSDALITGFAGHPFHATHPPKKSGTKRQQGHPTNPSSKTHKTPSGISPRRAGSTIQV